MEKGCYQGTITSYPGQYPDSSLFPTEGVTYVHQGFGEVSTQKPLSSEGFGVCSAFILLNLDTNCALLMHLDGEYLHSISESSRFPLKKKRYDVFMNEPGEKVALPVSGGVSFCRSGVAEQMEREGVRILPELAVESDGMHWDLLYNPETREVVVNNRQLKATISYTSLFPELDPARIQRAAFAVPLEWRIAEKENVEQRMEKAGDQVLRVMAVRDLKGFQDVMSSVQDCADWPKLSEYVAIKICSLPLVRVFGREEMYKFSGKIADDKSILEMIRGVSAYATDDHSRSGCIWALYLLSSGIARLESAKTNSEHVFIAKQAIDLAHSLFGKTSLPFQRDDNGGHILEILQKTSRVVALLDRAPQPPSGVTETFKSKMPSARRPGPSP
ncbi:MAG: hypothetical protein HY052_05880 [Proteobacteria bacterium]|nr:hypothetical protein [Pseudomonadota bacterium]